MKVPGEKIKNILKVRRTDNLVLTSSNAIEMNFNSNILKSGSKLQLNSSGKIVIGNGINCIRATFHVQFINVKSSARRIIYLTKNNNDFGTESKTLDVSYERLTLSEIIPVQNGDVISTKVAGTSGDSINAAVSYLEIEEISDVVWN